MNFTAQKLTLWAKAEELLKGTTVTNKQKKVVVLVDYKNRMCSSYILTVL